MTTLRDAAQQALEALESAVEYDYHGTPLTETHAGFNEAANALRAALTEDAMQKFTDVNQELMAALGCDHCNSPLYAATRCRVCGRVTEPERNFCPRCGKRSTGIHTCTPPGGSDEA